MLRFPSLISPSLPANSCNCGIALNCPVFFPASLAFPASSVFSILIQPSSLLLLLLSLFFCSFLLHFRSILSPQSSVSFFFFQFLFCHNIPPSSSSFDRLSDLLISDRDSPFIHNFCRVFIHNVLPIERVSKIFAISGPYILNPLIY